jgi:hypothetical protein
VLEGLGFRVWGLGSTEYEDEKCEKV